MNKYQLTGQDITIVVPFADDDAAFEYAHDMTDNDSAVVKKLIHSVWCDWDRNSETWILN